jgi:hypothetical protein
MRDSAMSTMLWVTIGIPQKRRPPFTPRGNDAGFRNARNVVGNNWDAAKTPAPRHTMGIPNPWAGNDAGFRNVEGNNWDPAIPHSRMFWATIGIFGIWARGGGGHPPHRIVAAGNNWGSIGWALIAIGAKPV